MSLTFTTAVPMNDITKLQVVSVDFSREAEGVAVVLLHALLSCGKIYGEYRIQIGDDTADPAISSMKIKLNASRHCLGDALAIDSVLTLTGAYANLKSAWFSAQDSLAARKLAAETAGLADGWIDSSLTGTVA